MKNNGYFVFIIDEVCTKLDFFPFGLETSDRSKPAKCSGKQIKIYLLLFLSF